MTLDKAQPTFNQQKALVRALERRYGQSVNAYVFQRIGVSIAEGPHWRVTDTETGSYVEGIFHLGRLNVRKEKDGNA